MCRRDWPLWMIGWFVIVCLALAASGKLVAAKCFRACAIVWLRFVAFGQPFANEFLVFGYVRFICPSKMCPSFDLHRQQYV